MKNKNEEVLKNLMLLALDGNAQAYKEFLEKTTKLLRSFLNATLGPRQKSPERVDDFVQEILLTIHRKRDLYKKDMSILPWIFVLARHRMIDQLRLEARRPQCVEWEQHYEQLCAVEMNLEAPAQGEKFLVGLSTQQRKIVWLAKVEEQNLAQIAADCGMSLSAVKLTVHRSLNFIRKNFDNPQRKSKEA